MVINTTNQEKHFEIINGLERPELLEAVKRLDQDYFDWPWTVKQWDELLVHRKEYLLLVHLKQSCDVGPNVTAMILFKKDPDCCHLLKLLVNPAERNKGAAQDLLDASLVRLDTESIYLEVAEGNLVAQKFYLKNNFRVLVVKKNFYRDGSNALAMQLKTK